MTDGINISIGKTGITGALAQSAGLTQEEAKRIPISLWSEILHKVKFGQLHEIGIGAIGNYASAEKVAGGKLDYNPASKDFDGWKFNKGDIVTINPEQLEEIQQLLRQKVGPPDLGIKQLATQLKPKKMEVTREIAGLPVTPLKETPAIADGRQITRIVDGKKQTIEITKDADGNKVHYLVNNDGTRGEKLVTVAKFGKNQYQTTTRYLAEHQPQQEIPTSNENQENRMYRTKNGEV